MKTDRELLELAAKAADRDYWQNWDGIDPALSGPAQGARWNPLTDDGDALRLAVKLGIDVDFCEYAVEVWRKDFDNFITETYGECAQEATRRAIVRAAAAIGEQM